MRRYATTAGWTRQAVKNDTNAAIIRRVEGDYLAFMTKADYREWLQERRSHVDC